MIPPLELELSVSFVGKPKQTVLEERVVERHVTLLSKPLVRRLFCHPVGPLHRTSDGANPNRDDPTEASRSACGQAIPLSRG